MSAKEGDDSTGQARVMRCWAIPHVKQTLETHNDIKLRMMSGLVVDTCLIGVRNYGRLHLGRPVCWPPHPLLHATFRGSLCHS